MKKYIEVLDSHKESLKEYIERKENDYKKSLNEFMIMRNKSNDDYINWFIRSYNPVTDLKVNREIILPELRKDGFMRLDSFICLNKVKEAKEISYDVYQFMNIELGLQSDLLLCEAYSDIEDYGVVNYLTIGRMKVYVDKRKKEVKAL